MNTIRWICGIIISIVILLIGPALIEPILNLIFSIAGGFGRTGWFDMPTDFGQNLSFFNGSLLPMCFAIVIAYGLGGFCCGKIIPAENGKLIKWICGIMIAILNIVICIYVWNGEHWFYSSIFAVTLIIAGTIYVVTAENVNEDYN